MGLYLILQTQIRNESHQYWVDERRDRILGEGALRHTSIRAHVRPLEAIDQQFTAGQNTQPAIAAAAAAAAGIRSADHPVFVVQPVHVGIGATGGPTRQEHIGAHQLENDTVVQHDASLAQTTIGNAVLVHGEANIAEIFRFQQSAQSGAAHRSNNNGRRECGFAARLGDTRERTIGGTNVIDDETRTYPNNRTGQRLGHVICFEVV